MSRTEILQLLGTLAGTLATIISAVEAKLVRRLRNADATSRERALELPGLARLTRWRLARLRGAGAVVEADPGRYYLDADGYRDYRRRRRIRAACLVALAIAIVLSFVWGLGR